MEYLPVWKDPLVVQTLRALTTPDAWKDHRPALRTLEMSGELNAENLCAFLLYVEEDKAILRDTHFLFPEKVQNMLVILQHYERSTAPESLFFRPCISPLVVVMNGLMNDVMTDERMVKGRADERRAIADEFARQMVYIATLLVTNDYVSLLSPEFARNYCLVMENLRPMVSGEKMASRLNDAVTIVERKLPQQSFVKKPDPDWNIGFPPPFLN